MRSPLTPAAAGQAGSGKETVRAVAQWVAVSSSSEPARAQRYVAEAVQLYERMGLRIEEAKARLWLGRTFWEQRIVERSRENARGDRESGLVDHRRVRRLARASHCRRGLQRVLQGRRELRLQMPGTLS